MICIQLNGETQTVAPCTLLELLEHHGWVGKRVAIERNGAIVPKSQYPKVQLQSGDLLEVVVAVGGG